MLHARHGKNALLMSRKRLELIYLGLYNRYILAIQKSRSNDY